MTTRCWKAFALKCAVIILAGSATFTPLFSAETKINAVFVNDTPISVEELSSLKISPKDRIAFSYDHVSRFGSAKVLYLTSFAVNGVARKQSGTSNISMFSGLEPGEYTFEVLAFSPTDGWKANPTRLSFSVSSDANQHPQGTQSMDQHASVNSEATHSASHSDSSLVDSAQSHPAVVKDSVQTSTALTSTSLLWMIGGVALVSMLVGAALSYFLFRNRPTHSRSLKVKYAGDQGMTQLEDLQKQLEQKSSELLALTKELNLVKMEIDRGKVHTAELEQHNSTLKESLIHIAQTKSQLEELQQGKDELFAMIVHDIKNPAALIKSLVTLLRSYDLTATEQSEIIDDINTTTQKIMALSHEISKVFAMQTNDFGLSYDDGKLSEVLWSVQRRNTPIAAQKEIQLFVEVPETEPIVEFDSQRIEEILDNLVSNAIKYTHKGGTVRLSYEHDFKIAKINVSDNGLGLSEEDLRRVFSKGGKLSAQPTAGESSTGLGLWIVQKLVEAHNGKVWVHSKLGKGSTFTVEIPLRQSSIQV